GRMVGAPQVARDITRSKRNEADLRFMADASRLLAELLDIPSTFQKIAGLAVPHFADWCAVDVLGPDGSLSRLAVAHVDPNKVQLAQDLYRRYPPDPNATTGVWNIVRTGTSELVPEIAEWQLGESIKDPELLRIILALGLKSYIGVPLAVR